MPDVHAKTAKNNGGRKDINGVSWNGTSLMQVRQFWCRVTRTRYAWRQPDRWFSASFALSSEKPSACQPRTAGTSFCSESGVNWSRTVVWRMCQRWAWSCSLVFVASMIAAYISHVGYMWPPNLCVLTCPPSSFPSLEQLTGCDLPCCEWCFIILMFPKTAIIFVWNTKFSICVKQC